MEKLETRTIKFEKYTQNWYGVSAGNTIQKNYTMSTKNIVDFDKYTAVQKAFKEKEVLDQLPPKAKVYFDKYVTFPRRKFAENYPNNKLARSPETADVFVIDKDAFIRNNFRIYFSAYFKMKDEDGICEDPESPLADKNNQARYPYYSINQADLDRNINDHLIYLDKPWVSCKAVGKFSDEVLTEDAFEKLANMLSSKDDNLKNLAMNMLTAYNYWTEKNKIAMLMILHWDNWRDCVDKKINVEMKTMLKMLRDDYGDFHRLSTDQLNRFWFRMIIEHPEDLMIFKRFSEYVKQFVQTPHSLKLIEVKDGEDNKVQEDSVIQGDEQISQPKRTASDAY